MENVNNFFYVQTESFGHFIATFEIKEWLSDWSSSHSSEILGSEDSIYVVLDYLWVMKRDGTWIIEDKSRYIKVLSLKLCLITIEMRQFQRDFWSSKIYCEMTQLD